MPVAAAIGLGAVGSVVAGNRAAGAAQSAANSANATQLQMFNESNRLNAPWRAQGTAAVNLLGNAFTGQPGGQEALNNAFFQSPGYQFRLEQGQNQLDRMAGRSGNFFSGRQLQNAQEYGQNFASNEFGNYINQLNSIAGLGQNSASQSASNAMNLGGMMGQNINAAGAARAGAYQNAGNAFSNLLGQGAWMYGNGMFNNQTPLTVNGQTNPALLSGLNPGGGFSYSDRRLKRDIEPVGTHNGLTVYAFRYLWDDAQHYGYMADEVEKVAPEAVSEDANGYKRVNYAKVH